MFIKRTARKDGSTLIQIAESVRKGEKIKQVILASIGRALNLTENKLFDAQAKAKIVQLLNERHPALPGQSRNAPLGGAGTGAQPCRGNCASSFPGRPRDAAQGPPVTGSRGAPRRRA